MITKERLEELIDQKTPIYWKSAKIKPSSWSKYTIIGNTIVKGNLKDIYSLYDLFETKEDAEWHEEFGCIERTERLVLPTWEEFINQKFVWFFDKNHKSCCLHYLGCSNQIFINIDGDVISIGDLTKENYTIACRKAKELFLGE